jgi:hypothetical protein
MLQLAGFRPRKDQNLQAEARATKTYLPGSRSLITT